MLTPSAKETKRPSKAEPPDTKTRNKTKAQISPNPAHPPCRTPVENLPLPLRTHLPRGNPTPQAQNRRPLHPHYQTSLPPTSPTTQPPDAIPLLQLLPQRKATTATTRTPPLPHSQLQDHLPRDNPASLHKHAVRLQQHARPIPLPAHHQPRRKDMHPPRRAKPHHVQRAPPATPPALQTPQRSRLVSRRRRPGCLL